jgi:alpha-glucosidase
MTAGDEWWRDAVCYQVYPRSFQDSGGDGVGDLAGLIARLDYLNDGTERSLGVDAIWLTPIFPSPQHDFGYDVSDYEDVDPVYGDLAALDRLLDECHARGIRVLLDLVLNHTSVEHPWFVEASSSRRSPKRDWYIWRDPAPDGGPPNNWRSVFLGRSWTLDERTGQYFLHSYLAEQPDLNWRNPEVERAMSDVIRFWLRRGVDGFRLDAATRILKDPVLPDDPPNPRYVAGGHEWPLIGEHFRIHEDMPDAARRIRRVFEEFPGTVAIAEVYDTPEAIAPLYGPPALDGFHLVFNFQLQRREAHAEQAAWDAERIARVLLESEQGLPAGAEACYALGNHDVPRLASRIAPAHDLASTAAAARGVALLLLGLRCPVFLYQGDEIGMVDVAIPPDRALDPMHRDPERTPMQWDRSPGRGFTEGEPWLPFGPLAIDVASQTSDPRSVLSLYRRAVWTRKRTPALRRGRLAGAEAHAGVVTFRRELDSDPPALVALNTLPAAAEVAVPPGFDSILLASEPEVAVVSAAEGSRLRLPPFAACWLTSSARSR